MFKPVIKLKFKQTQSTPAPASDNPPRQPTEPPQQSQGHSQPRAGAHPPDQPAVTDQHGAGPAAPAAERKTSFKIRVKPPPQAPSQQPAQQHQQQAGAKRPAGEGPGEGQAAKKPRIKLVTGPKLGGGAAPKAGAPAGGLGAAGAGAATVRPKIRLKTTGSLPPKQPRRDAPSPGAPSAAAPPASGGLSIRDLIAPRIKPSGTAAAAPAAGPTLPVVRLTIPSGGAKKPKVPKKARAPGGAGAPRAKGKGARGGSAQRDKAAAAAAQQLLLAEELEEEEGLDGPLVPRAPSARHAAVAATVAMSEGPQASGGSRSLGEEVGMFLDDDDDDVAFTEAPQAMLPSSSQPGAPGAAAEVPALPILPDLPEGGAPVKREDLERVVRLVQKKDHHGIFKEPVTEDVAPNYFTIIKEPMDFATMRGKMEKGEYGTYEDLQRDMRRMFLNAMTYNPPDSPFYTHARNMLHVGEKLVEQARQGVLTQRQAAGEARKQNAVLRAAERAQRDALRAAARAEQKAAQEAKVLKRAGVGDHHEESLDESIRNSYRRPLRDLSQARWKGLGGGASAEGAAVGWGRQILRPVSTALAPSSYAASVARFAAGLSGKARELATARAAAAVPNPDAGAAERLLQKQMARQPPPLPAPPAAAPAAAPATAAPAAAPVMPAGNALLNPATMLNPAAFHTAFLQMQQAQRPQQAAGGGQQGSMLPGMLSAQQLAALTGFKPPQAGAVAASAAAQRTQQQLAGAAPMTQQQQQQQALFMQTLLAQQAQAQQQQQQQPQAPQQLQVSMGLGAQARPPQPAVGPAAGGAAPPAAPAAAQHQPALQGGGVPGVQLGVAMGMPAVQPAQAGGLASWPVAALTAQQQQQLLLRPIMGQGLPPGAALMQGAMAAAAAPQQLVGMAPAQQQQQQP